MQNTYVGNYTKSMYYERYNAICAFSIMHVEMLYWNDSVFKTQFVASLYIIYNFELLLAPEKSCLALSALSLSSHNVSPSQAQIFFVF